MKFWDASAVVAVVVAEVETQRVRVVYQADRDVVVWWSTRVECESALMRRMRESAIAPQAADLARSRIATLLSGADAVAPTSGIRASAVDLVRRHLLRAADALQLAAALAWAEGQPAGAGFVCLDERLRLAAAQEGFTLLPR